MCNNLLDFFKYPIQSFDKDQNTSVYKSHAQEGIQSELCWILTNISS